MRIKAIAQKNIKDTKNAIKYGYLKEINVRDMKSKLLESYALDLKVQAKQAGQAAGRP